MSLSVGIVGLPNVGKSTLFNALLKRQVALAANYPFATVEPNVGVVEVPDERLSQLAETVAIEAGSLKPEDPLRETPSWDPSLLPPIVPATIKFVDIAGLVKGAAEGEGLGNQFLAHIREVDLICHVLRVFPDEDVVITGSLDPIDDLDTVRTELILKDLESISKAKNSKSKIDNIKEKQFREQTIDKIKQALEQGKMANSVELLDLEQEIIGPLQLLTNKPEIYALNVSEDQLSSISLPSGINPKDTAIISARIESELSNLSKEDQDAYLKELGFELSGIERMASLAYSKLNLISFLTAGVKEVRAWTIKKGTNAQESSGVIHTDFIKHFIKAIVMNYKDYIETGGWKQARELGKVRQEGKEYIVTDGDVIEFMIGK